MIGVIGSKGNIGNECVNLLKKYEKMPFKVGNRSPDLDSDRFYMSEQVDINNEESCIKFLKDCRCVINCTSVREMGTLLSIAKKTHTNVIDVHRDDKIYYSKENIVYTNVGVSPGLTEAIPAFCKMQFGEIERLKLMHIVNDKFSYEGAKEYLEYTFGNEISPMTSIKNCTVVPNKCLDTNITMGDESYKKLIYTDDTVKRICSILNIQNAEFSICFINGQVYQLLKSIKNIDTDINELSKNLVIASMLDTEILPVKEEFVVYVTTKTNKQYTVLLKSTSASKLTATAAIAMSIFSLKENRTGVFKMYETNMLMEMFDIMKTIDKSLFFKIYDGILENIDFKDSGVIE